MCKEVDIYNVLFQFKINISCLLQKLFIIITYQ